jgi:hypothetical protein
MSSIGKIPTLDEILRMPQYTHADRIGPKKIAIHYSGLFGQFIVQGYGGKILCRTREGMCFSDSELLPPNFLERKYDHELGHARKFRNGMNNSKEFFQEAYVEFAKIETFLDNVSQDTWLDKFKLKLKKQICLVAYVIQNFPEGISYDQVIEICQKQSMWAGLVRDIVLLGKEALSDSVQPGGQARSDDAQQHTRSKSDQVVKDIIDVHKDIAYDLQGIIRSYHYVAQVTTRLRNI